MDSTQSQAATSSSSLNPAHTDEPSQTTASESKVLRTSARVKAAKQKEKQKERSSADNQQATTSSAKRVRDSSSHKGKGKEVLDDTRASKRYVCSSCRLHYLSPKLRLCLQRTSFYISSHVCPHHQRADEGHQRQETRCPGRSFRRRYCCGIICTEETQASYQCLFAPTKNRQSGPV